MGEFFVPVKSLISDEVSGGQQQISINEYPLQSRLGDTSSNPDKGTITVALQLILPEKRS